MEQKRILLERYFDNICHHTQHAYPLILAILQQNHHDVKDAIRNRKKLGLHGVNFELANRKTPMQLAIENASEDNDLIVNILIRAGFDLSDRNDEYATPLIEQAKHNRSVWSFLDFGAKINDMDIHGHTALHHAINCQNEQSCDDILVFGHDKGLDIHLAGLGNISAIELAMQMKGTPGADLVLKHAYDLGMLDAEDMKELARG